MLLRKSRVSIRGITVVTRVPWTRLSRSIKRRSLIRLASRLVPLTIAWRVVVTVVNGLRNIPSTSVEIDKSCVA